MIFNKVFRHNPKQFTLSSVIGASLLFLVATLIVGAAQLDWSISCCLFASICGYALFWRSIDSLSTKWACFTSLFWYGSLSVLHCNWFFAFEEGSLFLNSFVLGILFFAKGGAFQLLTYFLRRSQLSLLSLSGLAALWVLFETVFVNHLFFTGCPMDPMGLSLTSSLFASQLASLFGMPLLSFCVCMTNLLFYRLLRIFSWELGGVVVLIALTPYLVGSLLYLVPLKNKGTLSIALFQISPPSETTYDEIAMRWAKIIKSVEQAKLKGAQVCIFPESLFAQPIQAGIVYLDDLQSSLGQGHPFLKNLQGTKKVNYQVLFSHLSRWSGIPIIGGFCSLRSNKDMPEWGNHAYLSHPKSAELQVYAKRILVVGGEYLPLKPAVVSVLTSFRFERLVHVLKYYPQVTAGKKGALFPVETFNLVPTICYEEMFGSVVRENARGGDLLINLTSDADFPRSRLPIVHYHHSRLRAIELGLPLVRACSIGVTGAVDAVGRDLGRLPEESARTPAIEGEFYLNLNVAQRGTLYSLCGGWPFFLFSLALFLSSLPSLAFNKKDQAR